MGPTILEYRTPTVVIKLRIALFTKEKRILNSMNIGIETTKNLFQSFIKNVVLYKSEKGTLREKMQGRIEYGQGLSLIHI